MFERIGTGWELVQQTWGVLWDDKKLLIFPLLSMIACLAVFASFAVPLWGSGYFDTVMDEQNAGNDVLGYVLLFAYYFANYFVIIFFNSALVACAIMRFEGQEPTLGDGIRAAGARPPRFWPGRWSARASVSSSRSSSPAWNTSGKSSPACWAWHGR